MKKIYAMLLAVVMIACLCPVGMKEAKAYNEPGEVIELRNENNSANVLYDFDCDVKAGSTISFTITSTWEKPMAVWVIGDLTYEYYAYGYDSGTGTYTIEDTLEHDLSKIRIQVQYRNESHKKDETTDKTGEVVTISNLEILSPDVVQIENPSGGKRVSYNVQKEVPAGRFVEFDISTNMGNQIAVWVLDEYIEYYAYGYENWTGKGHVRAEITRDISNFTILVEFRDTSIDFSQVVVTIDNIEVTYPDIYSPEEGVIELRNSKNSVNVLYDFDCDVKAGSKISFTFTTTWENPMALWIIGDLTYEYYGYGYDSGTGTYKVETTLGHDLSKLRIQVQYRTKEHKKDETSNKTKEVITITGLTITPPPHVCGNAAKTDAAASTCMSEGNIAYWTCECGKIYRDEACTDEITSADTVVAAASHTLIYHEAITPACHYNGRVEYWYCSVCEGFWTDEACTRVTNSKSIILPATGSDNMTHTEAKAATCFENGNVEYWYCADCEGFWLDEACTRVTNSKSVILPASEHNTIHFEAVEPGCHSIGNVEYWYCPDCEGFWTDEALTRVTNSKSVILPANGSDNVVHFDAVAPGCHYIGNIEYWFCPDCEGFWEDAAFTRLTNSKSVILPATGSDNVVHVEAKAPTCKAEGNIEHWYCKDCEQFWQNKELTQLTNSKNVILGKADHKAVKVPAVAAKIGKTGLTEGSKCSVCGTVLKAQVKTPALKLAAPKASKVTKATGGKKQITVKFKKVSGVTRYEIQYSLKKNMKGSKTVKVTKSKDMKAGKIVIKKLKAKKTYYVRIRTLKTVNGVTARSSWSKVVKVKTK